MHFSFPKIYPILDSGVIPNEGRAEFLRWLGASLADAGVMLLEYRNKTGSDAEILSDAAVLRSTLPGPNIKLILDDRADLVEQAGFDGVHVDAGDISAAEARKLLGPDRIIGTFGGSTKFLPGTLDGPADYLAIGPVFVTTTKQTSTPPIGDEGVRRLREIAGPSRVLTAAGGVTLASAAAILAAGASAVAVSAAILRAPDPAAEFRRWVKEIG
jgi:thiamine-phosphate pyrophosphorylase